MSLTTTYNWILVYHIPTITLFTSLANPAKTSSPSIADRTTTVDTLAHASSAQAVAYALRFAGTSRS